MIRLRSKQRKILELLATDPHRCFVAEEVATQFGFGTGWATDTLRVMEKQGLVSVDRGKNGLRVPYQYTISDLGLRAI